MRKREKKRRKVRERNPDIEKEDREGKRYAEKALEEGQGKEERERKKKIGFRVYRHSTWFGSVASPSCRERERERAVAEGEHCMQLLS